MLNNLFSEFRQHSLNLILLFVSILFTPALQAQESEADAPYVPTPDTVLKQMMEMGQVGPGDYLIDLGSGDGRIPIAAAKRGAYAHGIEIDSSLVVEARENARAVGVENHTAFIEGDIFKKKIHQANVITMYLFPELMERLKPRLLEQLNPGTRVVSHLFDMDGWEPDQKFTIRPRFQRYLSDIQVTDTLVGLTHLIDINTKAPSHLFPEHEIYLWVIPARAEGQWTWKMGEDSFRAYVKQEYQKVNVTVTGGGLRYETIESNLHGRRFSFALRRGQVRYNFSGAINEDSLRGTVQIHRGSDVYVRSWEASRDTE